MKPSIGEGSFLVVHEAARKTARNIAGNGGNPDSLAKGLSIADRQRLEQQGILESYKAEKSQVLIESTEKQ